MECRYCGSEDVEFDETVPLLKHPGKRTADVVMCNSCQAEYTESRNHTLIHVYQTPIEGIAEIVIFSDIPLDELKIMFEEMTNEGHNDGWRNDQ